MFPSLKLVKEVVSFEIKLYFLTKKKALKTLDLRTWCTKNLFNKFQKTYKKQDN